jgi:hypothetical protein
MNWTFTYLITVALFMGTTSLIGIAFFISQAQQLTSSNALRPALNGGLTTFVMSILGSWMISHIVMAIPPAVAVPLLIFSVASTAFSQDRGQKMLLRWHAAVGAGAVLSFVSALWLSTQPLF